MERLNYLALKRALELAEARASIRGATFRGWAIVLAKNVTGGGRDVISSQLRDNPAHADILLPCSTIDDDEVRKEHLVELAERSSWLSATGAKS